MRVVLDTNAWLDLFVFEDAGAMALGAALRSGAVRALRSHRTDEELRAVLIRPQFASRLEIRPPEPMLQGWRELAECIEPGRSAPWLCSDPDDQKFLDLAVAGSAQMLLTKDRALLRLARAARKSGLAILTPQTFRP
ncbi:PIN domain DNA-binding protein [Burkholderiales bacterium GJ-E10]|nr:PIN domain DNA-binding protein [Burkholderiales bacterium GJ-E10]